MPASRIELDFVAQRRKTSLIGTLILFAGIAAVYWSLSRYQDVTLEAELLDMKLSRYSERRADTRPTFDPEVARQIEATAISLTTPWSALLDDLEQAIADSGKDVALLQVAPDLEKKEISIAAEARSLPAALVYVERLQAANTIRMPTLESHEVRVADRQRPVRIEITAAWELPQ